MRTSRVRFTIDLLSNKSNKPKYIMDKVFKLEALQTKMILQSCIVSLTHTRQLPLNAYDNVNGGERDANLRELFRAKLVKLLVGCSRINIDAPLRYTTFSNREADLVASDDIP